jgi:type I restriction enzyme R subunit
MAAMGKVSESHVEEAALAWLSELGYQTANGLDIGPESGKPDLLA